MHIRKIRYFVNSFTCLSGDDYIEIAGIKSYGCHGVIPFEKKIKQLFVTDLNIWFDFRRSCTSDSISDTIDYSRITSKVAEIIEHTSYNLIEALANRIAEEILMIPSIQAVKIALTKQAPPVKEDIGYVKVVLFRDNKESID